MTSDEAPPPTARRSADLPGPSPARSLPGLVDVLDRAPARPVGRRPYRSAAARAGALRGVPLRPVRPAPPARSAPPGSIPARTVELPVADRPVAEPAGPVRALVRRLALWGAGPDGEYLAWRCGPLPTASADRTTRSGLVRRLALWGAGPSGEHLAWGRPAVRPPAEQADPPVHLREMPSTPVVGPGTPRPVAPRPVTPRPVALRPLAPRLAVLRPLVARPLVEPVGRGRAEIPSIPSPSAAAPERSSRASSPPAPPGASTRRTGWPPRPERRGPSAGAVLPARLCASGLPAPPSAPRREPGPARARGDPLSWPARGSPPPFRSRSSGTSTPIRGPAPASAQRRAAAFPAPDRHCCATTVPRRWTPSSTLPSSTPRPVTVPG